MESVLSQVEAAPVSSAPQTAVGARKKMRAIFSETYGPVDRLAFREIDQPVVADDGILIRVEAAGLHIGDCFAVKGDPFVMRLYSGLRKPAYGVPGFDFAGRVEAVGKNVTRFQPGDEVFGAGFGACAELITTSENQLARKPANLTMTEAAAIATSALAALHGLRDAGKIQPGQKVLINGASGGVGTFAVQIARSFGAEVTGVCSTSNVDLVRSIGADHVIDYTKEDFTLRAGEYDLILDNVENRSLADIRRALTPRGTLLLNSGTGASGLRMLIRLVKPLLLSPFVRQNLRRFLSRANHEDLGFLKDLVESGRLRPVVDRTFPLAETSHALRYIELGHAKGKVVVTV